MTHLAAINLDFSRRMINSNLSNLKFSKRKMNNKRGSEYINKCIQRKPQCIKNLCSIPKS